jgi:quercetin dioxygenase-like cupin family protein
VGDVENPEPTGDTIMRNAGLIAAAALLIAASPSLATAQGPSGSPIPAPADIHWGPAPAVFPAGAQMAVIQGDPGSRGPFTVRLRFPDGYRIAPHTHPTDENVTVISGTFRVGMGTQADPSKMLTLQTGGFVTAGAGMAHYAQAVGATVVQVHAVGPFTLSYVNPADLPKATPKQ